MTIMDIGVGDLGKFEDIDVSELASVSTDPMLMYRETPNHWSLGLKKWCLYNVAHSFA